MTKKQNRLGSIARMLSMLCLGVCTDVIADTGALWSHKTSTDAELLPVDQAFSLVSAQRRRNGIAVTWAIAPGYYLYRGHLGFESEAVDATHPIAASKLPAGSRIHDERGDSEIYRGTLIALLPPQAATITRLRVSYQGCADAGVCYPPQNKLIDIVSTTQSP